MKFEFLLLRATYTAIPVSVCMAMFTLQTYRLKTRLASTVHAGVQPLTSAFTGRFGGVDWRGDYHQLWHGNSGYSAQPIIILIWNNKIAALALS